MNAIDKARGVVRAADRLKEAQRQLLQSKSQGGMEAKAWNGHDHVVIPLTHKQILGLLRKKVRDAKVALAEAQR